jgi:hypothetical protein
MIPQTLPRFGPAFASLAPWRETLFWRSWLLPGVPESHRKGAKDAKGDSQASDSKLLRAVILSEQLLMIYLLPSLFFSASPRLRVSVVSLGCFWMDRRLSKTEQAPKKSRARQRCLWPQCDKSRGFGGRAPKHAQNILVR